MFAFQVSPVDLLIVSSFAEASFKFDLFFIFFIFYFFSFFLSRNFNKAISMIYSLDKMAFTLMKTIDFFPSFDLIVETQGMKNYSTTKNLN